ncbi:MAG: glycosyl hydrolase family 65 protein [Nocardioidaceae bacterium]
MRRLSVVLAGLMIVALVGPSRAASEPYTPALVTVSSPDRVGGYLLTATHRGPRYAPTFTGNGYLAVRVPAQGQGYVGGTVPTQSEVAGFYARPPGTQQVQQRANVPTWSTLRFTEGGHTFSFADGTVSQWRQQLDLHTGVITTTARWRAPDGHVTDLRYDVFTDRAQPYVAAVRLRLTPHWSGPAQVTDLIDGTPATLTTPVADGHDPGARADWESVRTQGTRLVAALASRLRLSPNSAAGTARPVSGAGAQSVGQRVDLALQRGHTYTVTKYVGVVTSQVTGRPVAYARARSRDAAATGYRRLLAQNTAAWSRLWRGRIDVHGNQPLATEVNASQFYLWSSTRDGVDWSISPAGLSSNGYDGHIFWDAETWMYPSLLAQHPDLAAGMNAYRFQRLAEARAHARATGWRGARFPWESALDGTEQIPPPVSVNSEGLYEQHITSDIALAQWQYYLVTRDRHWLLTRGWPVLSGAARFWASRVVRGAHGSEHLRHVTGPDEENPDVTDEAYTNVAAATTLRHAASAARILGKGPHAAWDRIANHLVLRYDSKLGIHPEFAGYQGQLVKQADVTMLQYPWRRPMAASVAQRDLNYYVQRTDPLGPSMSDAISSIDTAALGSPGCASYAYTVRSIDPFIRDVFDQFSETSTGGAFTFSTGIGGFLQEFLYGYTGLRWNPHTVQLDPSLTGRLGGVTLHSLRWRGRSFTVDVGPRTTRVTLQSGPPLPVSVRGKVHRVRTGAALVVPTRRPDRTPTADVARCRTASASSATSLGPALAAVDGSPATFWQPTRVPATLTVSLGRRDTIGRAVVSWGRQWPPAPAPNVPPPPKPVLTLRAISYDVQVSADGHSWRTVARVRGRKSGLRDVLTFPATGARYVRLRVHSATHHAAPKLQELTLLAR